MTHLFRSGHTHVSGLGCHAFFENFASYGCEPFEEVLIPACLMPSLSHVETSVRPRSVIGHAVHFVKLFILE